MLDQNDILKQKYQNLLKIAEIFVIFANVDTVAAWFDRPNIGRLNSQLITLVYSKKNFVRRPIS